MSTLDEKRTQLQRLYCELVDADGIHAVHRLLSEAIIAHKREAKKPAPRPREHRKAGVRNAGASEIIWQGTTLPLGEAMRCCTAKQQLFVMHYVHAGRSKGAAEREVGYSQGGVNSQAASIRAAIAEERQRVSHGQ